MATNIVLDGYRPINNKWPVYVLDVETNKVEVRWFKNQKEGGQLGPQVGMGDFRKAGTLLNRKKGFFAVYTSGNSIFIWLDGQNFDLLNEDLPITIIRDVDFLLRTRFRVFAGNIVKFEYRYYYIDWEEFPDTDIFWYMARELVTINDRVRALILWQDKAKGNRVLTDEYMQILNARVSAAMKSR